MVSVKMTEEPSWLPEYLWNTAGIQKPIKRLQIIYYLETKNVFLKYK